MASSWSPEKADTDTGTLCSPSAVSLRRADSLLPHPTGAKANGLSSASMSATEHAFAKQSMLWLDPVKEGEPLLSGLPEGEEAVMGYINERGLNVMSDVGARELTQMYLVGSDGTLDGKPPGHFRIVHAKVP